MLGELESQRAKIDSIVKFPVPCYVYYYLPRKRVAAGDSGILRGQEGTRRCSSSLAFTKSKKLSGRVLREN